MSSPRGRKRPNRDRSVRVIQRVLGTVFAGMGLATMLFPTEITSMSLHKKFLGEQGVTAPLKLAMQCFGSQATLCGVLILSSEFTASTYQTFGVAMIPYFVFDYYFWCSGALTTFGAAGDAMGNIVFSVCCLLGYNKLSRR